MIQKKLEERCDNNERELGNIKESLEKLTSQIEERGKAVAMLVTEECEVDTLHNHKNTDRIPTINIINSVTTSNKCL